MMVVGGSDLQSQKTILTPGLQLIFSSQNSYFLTSSSHERQHFLLRQLIRGTRAEIQMYPQIYAGENICPPRQQPVFWWRHR